MEEEEALLPELTWLSFFCSSVRRGLSPALVPGEALFPGDPADPGDDMMARLLV